MKAYLSLLSPGNISYAVASYSARIFVSGLVLVTIVGVFVFVFLAWGATKEIPRAGVKIDTVSEERLLRALEIID